MSTHYFWAVKIPDEVKRVVGEKINQVKGVFPFERWVHYQDYHITLEFLGLAEQKKLELCSDSIKTATLDMTSFNLDIIGLNVFGQANMPRVFWAAVNGEERLNQLQHIVHEECIKAEFKLDERPYHPHVTLARKWVGQEAFQKNYLIKHNPFIEPIRFEVTECVLYNVNNNTIPKYKVVKTIKLNP